MGDIYQDIWNADQAGNGIPAILHTETGNRDTGFVKVNADLDTSNDRSLRVLPEAVIPTAKSRTYDLCRKLFDNYALPEPELEIDTAQEREEVHQLVDAMIDTGPMIVARDYVTREAGTIVTRERWHTTIVDMWFRTFAQGGDPALSGFEHVVVGEQERSKVQGYHFWWKYYLDDGFAREVDGNFARFPGLSDDRIEYLGSRGAEHQEHFPESVTISFKWSAPDYVREQVRPLNKKIGGFFVGCSVEGLLALGTVRGHRGVRAPKVAVIEGARYDMKMFLSGNQQHVRTFYPVFLGPADPVNAGGRTETSVAPVVIPQPVIVPQPGPEPEVMQPVAAAPSTVRIIAAVINPEGHDPGMETVTLVNTGATPQAITDWEIVDKNGNAFTLAEEALAPGAFRTFTLTGRDAQLSNKGGDIVLVDDAGTVQHKVSYSKAQASRQGITVLF